MISTAHSPAKVNPGPLSQDSIGAHPGRLQAHTAYFWRVDARLADGTTAEGQIWSFTTGAQLSCVLSSS